MPFQPRFGVVPVQAGHRDAFEHCRELLYNAPHYRQAQPQRTGFVEVRQPPVLKHR